MKRNQRKIRLRVVTLGCSKNRVDTEHLLAILPSGSFELVEDGHSDAILLNTCGFIGDAKEESIEAVLEAVEAKKRGETGRVIVFGCLSQRYSSEMPELIPEVDAWYGARDLAPVAGELRSLSDALAGYPSAAVSSAGSSAASSASAAVSAAASAVASSAAVSSSSSAAASAAVSSAGSVKEPLCDTESGRYLLEPDKGYAYFKISEGCDRRCSYCAIPLIRGAHRSVPIEKLVSEASGLAARGVRELIIIAQDSTFYGLDLYGRRALGELLRALSAVEGIEWLRIHYSYPADFPDDVIEEMASNPKVLPYMDIPLQHIADTVLEKMHRHVTGEWTRELVRRMRERVPGLYLRTTMIVGHPGEGEKEFEELLDFVRETRFERLGAFTYSEEEGTWGAANLSDDVPEDVKRRRLDALMSLQSEISLECNRARIGSVEKVMVDDCVDGYLVCRSRYESPEVDGEILVKCPDGGDMLAGVAGADCADAAGVDCADAVGAAGVAGGAELIGHFINVRIIGADTYDLIAELC